MVRRALITGGTAGLGFATAQALAGDGFDIVLTGRDNARAERAVTKLVKDFPNVCVHALISDLEDPEQTRNLFVRAEALAGPIDCLIVNSGHMPYGAIETLSDGEWYDAFEILLMSAVRLSRSALCAMRSRRFGDVVFITGAEFREPSEHLILAGTFRAGIANMAKNLSRIAAADNVRINTVAPGYFYSGRVRQRVNAIAEELNLRRDQAIRLVAGENPMGRAGDPEELGALISFLVGRKAAFLNGAVITVDGGKGASFI